MVIKKCTTSRNFARSLMTLGSNPRFYAIRSIRQRRTRLQHRAVMAEDHRPQSACRHLPHLRSARLTSTRLERLAGKRLGNDLPGNDDSPSKASSFLVTLGPVQSRIRWRRQKSKLPPFHYARTRVGFPHGPGLFFGIANRSKREASRILRARRRGLCLLQARDRLIGSVMLPLSLKGCNSARRPARGSGRQRW